MKSIAAFIFLFLGVVTSFQLQQNVPRLSARSAVTMMKNTDESNSFDSMGKAMKSKVLPVLLGASLFLNNPVVSDAVPSGGRSGGSSFRSAPSSRSYSTSRSYSSRSSYDSRPSVTIMPTYSPFSPFGFSPFGFSPFGFSPFGFMPINLNLLILGGIAYVVYNALKNRAGGSDFSDVGDTGALGSGATVLKIQIGLDSDWAQSNNVMNTLALLAEKNSALSGRSDIAKLLNEASLALLRRQNDWNSANFESELFGGSGVQAEPFFQRLAVTERAKFEEETSSIATIRPSSYGSSPTQVVVSIIAAVRGKSSAYTNGPVRSVQDVKTVLSSLAADAVTDEGDNIMAVEVLWTPSEAGMTITPRELIEDYPELIRL